MSIGVHAPTVCARLTCHPCHHLHEQKFTSAQCNSSNVMTKSTFSPILSSYGWGLIVHHCITNCIKKYKRILHHSCFRGEGGYDCMEKYITVNVFEIMMIYSEVTKFIENYSICQCYFVDWQSGF